MFCQQGEHVAGDRAFEATQDLFVAAPLGTFFRDVVTGARLVLHADQGDAMQGSVGLSIPAAEDKAQERTAFDRVVEAYEKAIDGVLDRVDVARIRSEVVVQNAAKYLLDAPGVGDDKEEPPPQLEVEVVAIYW